MAVLTLPPGPRGRLLLGNLPDFRSGRLEFFARCAQEYGSVVRLRMGPRRLFLVTDPALIEEVLVTNSRHFIKHFALRLNPLVLGKGLLTSEGDFWLRQRRLIQPAFNRDRLAGYAQAMVAAAERMLAGWEEGQTREVLADMMALTLDIAARTLFSAEISGAAREVGEALHLLQANFLVRFSSLMPVPIWVPTPTNRALRRAVARLDAILYGFIAQRRQEKDDKEDLLSLLLHARDEMDGRGMSDRQLRDEAMTLFLAGHETTALALTWSWYLLARHPQVAERLTEEAVMVLEERRAGFDDVARLRFAECVALESMRLYPPVYTVGREALREGELGGFRLPRGTTVLMSEWIVHHDGRFYEKPGEFRPERWEEGLMERLPRYAYFPFGGGPRGCIGNTFAMTELVLVLATLARKVRFTLQPGLVVEPWPTFTLRPDRPMLAPVVRRY